jgi:Mn-dependent DtxR family transcriptional regulator
VDVARALSYSKPSVYQAVCKLKDEGYLEEEGLDLVLTKEGNRLAEALIERRETIIRFLMMAVNVDRETAEADAKRMTYFVSEKTYYGMKQFISE